MKKYLKETETAAMLLLAIGVLLSVAAGRGYGMWPCAVGLLLWVVVMLYKSFHWTEYAAENKRNVVIMLVAILLLIVRMLWLR